MNVFGSSNPYLLAGTIIACPSCRRPVLRLTRKQYSGQGLGGHHEWLMGKVLKQGIIQWKSRCCLVDWYKEGKLYTLEYGWFPGPLVDKRKILTEIDSYVSRGRKYFFGK